MNTRSLKVSVLVLTVIAALGCLLAKADPEFVPIQERAEGRSLGGAVLLNDSLYSNPAASAFTQAYQVEGTYGLPRSFAASVLDTRTSEVGGAFGYFRTQDIDQTLPVQGLKLALNTKASSILGLGISGKVMWGQGTDMTSQHLNDLDAGMIANLGALQLGYSLHNILGGNLLLNQEREMALGARIGYEQILFFNATIYSLWAPFKPNQFGFGAEYVTPYYFSLKGGYHVDAELTTNNYWTAGVSFLTPKLDIHYAVEFLTAPGQSIEHTLALSLAF